MRLALKATLAVAVLIPLLCANAPAAVVGTLKAGAARVEITPDPNAIPRPYTSILDPIYARAIYLDNGHDRAVLLNADIGAVATTMTEKVSSEISRELNVPAANILISATHDHNAIFGGRRTPGSEIPAALTAFEKKLQLSLLQAAKQAKDSMQSARIGYGTGNLYLNVNRDAIDEQTRLWAQQANLEYPSDKTLAVIKIESLTGDLIAVYMNYAMHANSLLLNGKMSGDFPGEAERYVEHGRALDQRCSRGSESAIPAPELEDRGSAYSRCNERRTRGPWHRHHACDVHGESGGGQYCSRSSRTGTEHTTHQVRRSDHRGGDHPRYESHSLYEH
jgi:neutral ceramidase